MSDLLRGAFRGVKPFDWLLVGVLLILGTLMMLENITASDADVAKEVASGSLYHSMSSHSVWMLPFWLLAIVPVLWWRRSVIGAMSVSMAFVVLHDLLFGWVGRCGSGLPLALTLIFLGAVSYDRAKAWLSFGLGVLLMVAVLAVDAITGLGPLLLSLPIGLVLFAVGRGVRHRSALSSELLRRNAELQQLRDDRAALGVADDRARLSQELDGLLQERLGSLAARADTAARCDPAQAKVLLETIEQDSRATLDDMRELVGLLRGDDLDMAPTPGVAHLEALLAARTGSRLRVSGEARSLPATVELSAYRIVEHLVTVLAAESQIDVQVRFDDDALEIRVSGSVEKGADVKAAIARAKERAKLLGGSVEVKVARGQASALAELPLVTA